MQTQKTGISFGLFIGTVVALLALILWQELSHTAALFEVAAKLETTAQRLDTLALQVDNIESRVIAIETGPVESLFNTVKEGTVNAYHSAVSGIKSAMSAIGIYDATPTATAKVN